MVGAKCLKYLVLVGGGALAGALLGYLVQCAGGT